MRNVVSRPQPHPLARHGRRRRWPVGVIVAVSLVAWLSLPAAAAAPGWTTAGIGFALTEPAGHTVSLQHGAVDIHGNEFVAGTFDGTVAFGPGSAGTLTAITGSQSTSNFVASYSSTGSFRWVVQIGNGWSSSITGVALTPGGNVVVAGSSTGTQHVSRPGAPVVTVPGRSTSLKPDEFIATIGGASGNVLWAHTDGGPQSEYANQVAVDATGLIDVAGTFSGQTTFGSGPSAVVLTAAGLEDGYVAGYTATGALRFATDVARGGGSNTATDIAVGSGAVYVTGQFGASATVAGTPVYALAPGAPAWYVARLDPATGAGLWVRLLRAESSAAQLVPRLTTSAQWLYLTATLSGGSFDLGPPGYHVATFTSGPIEALVVRLSNEGQYENSTISASLQGASVEAAGRGPYGSVLIAGDYTGSTTIGGASLPTSGNQEWGYVADIGSTMAATRVSTVPTTSGFEPVATSTASGSPVVTARTQGTTTLPGGTTVTAPAGELLAFTLAPT